MKCLEEDEKQLRFETWTGAEVYMFQLCRNLVYNQGKNIWDWESP